MGKRKSPRDIIETGFVSALRILYKYKQYKLLYEREIYATAHSMGRRYRDCAVCSGFIPCFSCNKFTAAINHKSNMFIKVWQRNACSDKRGNMTTKNWWRYLTFPASNRRDFWYGFRSTYWLHVMRTLFSAKRKHQIGPEILCMKYVGNRRWLCGRAYA